MNILIQNLRHVNKGSLRAFVDIEIGGIQIKDCQIIQQAGQQPWFSTPQKSWTTPTGAVKYSSIVTLPKELQLAAQKAALNALEAANG